MRPSDKDRKRAAETIRKAMGAGFTVEQALLCAEVVVDLQQMPTRPDAVDDLVDKVAKADLFGRFDPHYCNSDLRLMYELGRQEGSNAAK